MNDRIHLELRGSHGRDGEHRLTAHFGTKGLETLSVYRDTGGYQALRKAVCEMSPDEVIDLVKASGLRGRGGAGFSTGTKWGFMPKAPTGPQYLVCNADESEPGSSKDRYLMENCPHGLIEGIVIGSYAMRATQAWIYVRGEYDLPIERLQAAIREAYAEGLLGERLCGSSYSLDIGVYRGHGAYICGEESALLESLEGKRAQP